MHDLEAQLLAHFGFDRFRPLQREIITQILDGRSVVGILPTGAGKSLCYQLPALLLPGITIVISPLISLMKDQTDGLVSRGIKALAINSHDTPSEARAKLGAMVAGEAKLIFVAPERLQNSAFLAACRQVTVSLLAVDEAHCVSQWGHDFRPEYRQIGAFHDLLGRPPMLALTATARPAVQEDLMGQLGIPEAAFYKASANRPNLWLGLEACATEVERASVLAHLLREQAGSAVVYVTSRRDAETLAERLAQALGEPVVFYHAGMEPDRRTAVQNRFMTDLVRIVVATSAFGMGIDKPDIRMVLHAGVPDSLEAYFQEIGRAGRDGDPARCLMVLIPGRDIKGREFLVRQSGDATAWDRFRQIRNYVYLEGDCRRSYLLRYFGERQGPQAEACCSHCHPLAVSHEVDAAAATRKRKGARAQTAAVVGAGGAGWSPGASPHAAALLDHLKQWRRVKAADQGVPAFVIFGDKDLMGIAEVAPASLDALAACRGIGPAKLKLYGEELLGEIARFASAPPPAEPPAPKARATSPAEKAELLARAGALFAQGLQAAEVGEALDRAEATVWQYLLDWIAADSSGAWKESVRQVLSREAYREINATCQGWATGLKEVFERLEGRYGYEQLRVARAVFFKAQG